MSLDERAEQAIQESYELDFIQRLIRMDYLDGAELGVAKQYVGKGPKSLTERQKEVIAGIFKRLAGRPCEMCSNEIPWSEKADALDNGGYCGYCQHRMEKLERE